MNPCNRKIIGLTGGIATGKSTASSILIEMGYLVIDADKIARQVVEVGKPAYEEIVKVFGKGILDDENNIDRKKLASLIFKDSAMRKKLNAIVHPHIFQEMKDKIEQYKDQRVIFLDVPLLIEELDKFKEYEIDLDDIWLVYVDENTQLDRLIKRDKINREEAIRKIRTQISIEEKKKYVTKIIDNRKDINNLKEQITKLLKESI